MYIDPELITDETATAEAVLSGTADRINSALGLAEDEAWEAQEGSPETSFAEAVGIVIATACAMVQEQERNDFASWGELILNTPRQAAEPATGVARWDFSDASVHLIPDGSEFVLDAPDGTPVAFATVGDVTSDGTSASVDNVPITALEPGMISEGLSGSARDFEPLPGVIGVAVVIPTSGAADEETRDDYLDRIVRRARRMKLVPIVTDDYADTALDHPAVGSAMAVRLLDLDNPTDPPAAGGHVTVFTRDAAGAANTAADKAEVLALMQGTDRPLGVTVHIGDPTVTNLTVAVSIRLSTGADEPATVAAVQAAIDTAYDPATFGIDDDAPGRWRPPRNDAERTINAYDVASVIDDLPGVEKIEAVTINGAASVTLNGWAPLPNLTAPATVTVLT